MKRRTRKICTEMCKDVLRRLFFAGFSTKRRNGKQSTSCCRTTFTKILVHPLLGQSNRWKGMDTLTQQLWFLKSTGTVEIIRVTEMSVVTAIEALQEGNNRIRSTNYQLRARRECQKLSMLIFKGTLISCRQRADCAENQAQDFIVRVAEL